MKQALYGVMVAAFLAAGAMDVAQGLRAGNARSVKLGVISIGLGLLNALLFFWRTGR